MTIKTFVGAITSEATILASDLTASGKAGCEVRTIIHEIDRYVVDFATDFRSEGWQQFDTDQDASYFGVWLNPRTFQVLQYAEGDWQLIDCHDRDRYRGEVQRLIDFHAPGEIATVIDADGTVTVIRQDRSAFLGDGLPPQLDTFGWAADERARQDEIAEDRRTGCQD